jgi:hypothetical protein|tara:strand:+ start:202 stop:993 length:792 start_codon:yes stop_codon:yes gene_type:complete
MSEFQILGFADSGPSAEDQPFGVSTAMNNNVMTLPSYIPPINFLTYYVFEFESHTSSTSPYIVIIKKDGVEVVRSLSITSGNLETTVLDFHDIDDDSGYTAHLEFCGDITFELLRFVFTQNSKQSQFDPIFSQVFEQDYPSTNLIHTDPCDDGTGGNEGNQVSSTGNYRQQTTGNLGATTSCPTCTTGTRMRVSACQGGVDWTMENTYNHSVNEIVQYQQGVPGSGVIWCGTVEEIDLSTTPDATVYGAITRECGDTVHCHEI